MLSSPDTQKSLLAFRPYCAALASKPSAEILQKLSTIVAQSNPCTLENLQEYIIFPCQLYLRTPVMPENYTIQVLNFIRDYFRPQVNLNSSFLLTDILNNVLQLVSDQNGPKVDLSEDLMVAVCQCMKTLINSSNSDVKLELYSEKQKLAVSHLVYQTLDWCLGGVKSVVMASLDLIDVLCYSDMSGEVYGRFFSQFYQMLPGITTNLVKLLMQQNLPPKLSAKCFKIWSRYVCAIFRDDNVAPSPNELRECGPLFKISDSVWIGKAQDHLLTHVQFFARSFTAHSSVLVRKSLLRLCQDVIDFCAKVSLPNTHFLLFEILATFLVDLESNEMRASSDVYVRKLLDVIREKECVKLEFCDDVRLFRNISEKVEIFDLCEKLSLRFKIFDEGQLDRDLSKLNGYLKLLKILENSVIFFHSESYVEKLLECLLNLSNFDTSTPFIVAQNFVEGRIQKESDCSFIFEAELDFRRPEKRFKHLTTSGHHDRFTSIVQTIASYSNSTTLVNFLLVKVTAESDCQTEGLFLLNEIILASNEFSGDDIHLLLESILEAYLSLDVISQNRVGTCGVSTLTLVSEGCGFLALASRRANRQREFCRDNLGAILSHLLSHHVPSQDASNDVLACTFNDLAEAFSFSDKSSMIISVIDYLSIDLCMLLRRHLVKRFAATNKRPRGLRFYLNVVLSALHKKNGSPLETEEGSSPELAEVMNVLIEQLDLSWLDPDKSVTLEILQIILTFVSQFNVELHESDTNISSKAEESGTLTKLIVDLKNSDELFESTDESSEPCPDVGFHQQNQDNSTNPVEDDENTEKKVSPSVGLIKKSIEHCRHFISMVACPQWQLTALQIVSRALFIIKDEENVLLPLVHQSWQPLKLLFESENIFVVNQAFECLMILARCSGDFIQKRTTADVLPAIYKYLQKLKLIVCDKNLKYTMLARQSRHLLQEMTKGLWDFMSLMHLSEVDVDPIIDNMLEFVNFVHENPKMFNDLPSFRPHRTSDDDILWLKMLSVKC